MNREVDIEVEIEMNEPPGDVGPRYRHAYDLSVTIKFLIRAF